MTPLRIAINGRFLLQPVTGVQRYARELVGALDDLLQAQMGVAVEVYMPRMPAAVPRWKNIGLHVAGKLRGHAWEQFELPRLSAGQVLFCPGNTAPAASLLSRQKVVVCVHDLSYKYFPEAYSRAFRLLYGALIPLVLRRADAIVTVSESERLAITRYYPFAASRLVAIQNGGRGRPAEQAPAVPASIKGYVLYVGSLSKRKNFPGMLEAACRLVRRRGFSFVFVGAVSSSLTASAGTIPDDMKDHIRFAGQVDDPAELAGYYENAACFLFPSFYEASPLPPIEAMAFGCPVIASDIPSLRERCGAAAVYCDPGSIASIEQAVERVMDDASLRETLRLGGYRRSELFSWEACARRVLDVIRDVSAPAGGHL